MQPGRLALTKTGDGFDIDLATNTVTYTLTITNQGQKRVLALTGSETRDRVGLAVILVATGLAVPVLRRRYWPSHQN